MASIVGVGVDRLAVGVDEGVGEPRAVGVGEGDVDDHARALHPALSPGLVTVALRDAGRWLQTAIRPADLPLYVRELEGRADPDKHAAVARHLRIDDDRRSTNTGRPRHSTVLMSPGARPAMKPQGVVCCFGFLTPQVVFRSIRG